MKTVGYTVTQAERIKRGISKDMAAIEDIAYSMQRRVSDHSLSVDTLLEQMREIHYELIELVDRRTRGRH